jgi:hypothetical protein
MTDRILELNSNNELVLTDPATGNTERAGGLQVLTTGSITLTSGSQPAFDGTLQGVTTDQTVKIVAINLYVGSDPSFNGDYAWNHDFGQKYDDANGEVDINLTVNWDIDPGSNLTLQYEVLTN